MSRITLSASVASNGVLTVAGEADAINTVATTTVAADVATLVADGATPTQAHVTTLNTDWAALLAGTGAVPARQHAVLSFDTTKWTRTTLRQALRALLNAVEGGAGGLSA